MNCILFDKRPFDTIEEHDEALIANWNSVVTEDDHVYILGDFSFRNAQPVVEYTERLKGHLHLIRGITTSNVGCMHQDYYPKTLEQIVKR